jgi:hypothetical protein
MAEQEARRLANSQAYTQAYGMPAFTKQAQEIPGTGGLTTNRYARPGASPAEVGRTGMYGRSSLTPGSLGSGTYNPYITSPGSADISKSYEQTIAELAAGGGITEFKDRLTGRPISVQELQRRKAEALWTTGNTDDAALGIEGMSDEERISFQQLTNAISKAYTAYGVIGGDVASPDFAGTPLDEVYEAERLAMQESPELFRQGMEQAGRSRGQQAEALGLMGTRAKGGDLATTAQSNLARDAAQRQMMSQVASASNAGAARGAQFANAQAQQGIAGQAFVDAIKERDAAQRAYFEGAGSMRGQDVQSAQVGAEEAIKRADLRARFRDASLRDRDTRAQARYATDLANRAAKQQVMGFGNDLAAAQAQQGIANRPKGFMEKYEDKIFDATIGAGAKAAEAFIG